MSYGSHKFRSSIGKVRAVRAHDKVLVAYSGGLASGTMLKLVQQGKEQAEDHRRLIFHSTAVYIDESELLGQSYSERAAHMEKIKLYAQCCEIPIYTTALEYSLVSCGEEVELVDLTKELKLPTVHSELVLQLHQLFASCCTLTAKEDLLWRLKQRLLLLVAKKLDHVKIFVGSSGTRLASHLLASVAQGRGAQIGDEIGFSDARAGVSFLRPMREFIDKEVAYMAHFLGVESVSIPTLSTKTSSNASVERLMEDFVVKIQKDFPGTISTLFRTGDKLASTSKNSQGAANSDARCLLCKSFLEQDPTACSAASARNFSQLVSRLGEAGMAKAGDLANCCSSSCSGPVLQKSCCKSAKELPSSEDWNASLCYGCQLTVHDMKTTEYFPPHFQEEAKGRARREKMRKSIEQFLL